MWNIAAQLDVAGKMTVTSNNISRAIFWNIAGDISSVSTCQGHKLPKFIEGLKQMQNFDL